MSDATVISLDEWRAARSEPDDPPPAAPLLRLVGPDERPGDVFRLEVFLARARMVLGETAQTPARPALRAVHAR
jgi:hypothetical protein